jgi:monovalent cation:H+ antiporter-2, CPA2 family
MHDIGLIVTLSAGLAAALVFGFVTEKLRLSPILGYLLAGIAVGPHTPGFVADAAITAQLAEVGVVLLMFGVGLHFRLADLFAVRRIAVPGAVGQSVVATLLAAGVAHWFGWGFGAGLALGVGLSVASTVVLMRVLSDSRQLDTPHGHVAVGWLVVEDIFTVLVLVLLPVTATVFGGGGGGFLDLAKALLLAILKVGLLAAVMLVVGARVIPWMLMQVARTRSRELFTLAILAVALVIATVASLVFGVSMALGAFLAGMVVAQSKVSHQAAADALPMRDAFAVLFFVSVGMLFDPRFLLAEPGLTLATLLIVLVAKPLVALLIVDLMGYSVRTALVVAFGLAQIGEFSFIVAELARKLGVLPAEGHSVLVAAALISIAANPALFRTIGPIEAWLKRRPRVWSFLNRRSEARAGGANAATAARLQADAESVHAVVVGYGPAGRTVCRILEEFGVRTVVVDLNVDTVARLSAEGRLAIYGDASRTEILQAAGIERASYLLLTMPDPDVRIPVILAARELNPKARILVRAHYLAERPILEGVGATAVYEEGEAAVALAGFLLREIGADEARIDAEAARIRAEFARGAGDPLAPDASRG